MRFSRRKWPDFYVTIAALLQIADYTAQSVRKNARRWSTTRVFYLPKSRYVSGMGFKSDESYLRRYFTVARNRYYRGGGPFYRRKQVYQYRVRQLLLGRPLC